MYLLWYEQGTEPPSIIKHYLEKATVSGKIRIIVVLLLIRTIEWTAQLLQTNSLLAQKNAEIRDLEETLMKLQKSQDKNESIFNPLGRHFTEEMEKK